MADNKHGEEVAAIREIMDDIDHGIRHNGNDHSGGPLSNCPRCVTDSLLSALEAAEERAAKTATALKVVSVEATELEARAEAAEADARQKAEALEQARECCARPAGVCFPVAELSEADARQQREGLERAKLRHAALGMAIDDGDDYGEHVGLQRYRRAVHDGQAEILMLWEEAAGPLLPEPPPLPPALGRA